MPRGPGAPTVGDVRSLTLTLAALLGTASCAASAKPYARVALAARGTVAGSSSYAPWPQASHDARRSGSSPYDGPQTGHVAWTRRLEGNVTPGPVIGPGGVVYAASNAGVLHAVDGATGEDLWTYDGKGSYGIDLSTSPAVLADGTVLWPGPRGRLFALSPEGSLLWELDLGSQVTSPAVDGARVVVGTQGGDVVSVDPRTGTVRWRVALGGSSYGSVALSPTDPHRAYQSVGTEVVALDDDRVAWRRDLGDLVEVSPAVGPDGTVVIGSNGRREVAFSPGGRPLWGYALEAETYSSPVVTDDGIAYVGDHDGVVTGLGVTDGRVLSRVLGPTARPADNRSIGVWTSPAVDARHDVYWGTRSGHVVGAAPDGRTLFDLDVGATVDSYPALGDGLLVVGLTDGRLLGIAA